MTILKKAIIIFFILCSSPLFSAELFHEYGVILGLNTMKFLGNLSSVQPQILRKNSNNRHPGGGLQYIASGIDLSAIFFLDSNLKHRVVFGGEYIGLESREIATYTSSVYGYKQHNVNVFDVFAGYHYAFFKTRFQNIKCYAGAEIMLNNILKNESEIGEIYLNYSDKNNIIVSSKDAEFRLGTRIKLGFEGRLYENLYINTNFAVGAYNLLGRNDANGELFNSKNMFETKESVQFFFNYLLSLQYRFPSTSQN